MYGLFYHSGLRLTVLYLSYDIEAGNNKHTFSWGFDQSERTLGAIYIIMKIHQSQNSYETKSGTRLAYFPYPHK